MDSGEIGAVLARATELHAKISDAIERTLKKRGEAVRGVGGAQSGGGPAYSTKENHTDSNESTSNKRSSGSPREGVGGQFEDATSAVVDENASEEARSLEGIRDALGILEEQLQSLQKLQRQQRAEKETIIADLEKCRRLLLRRVKEHCGKEKEVVREALAFVGEPVEDDGDDPNLADTGSPTSDTHDPSDNRWGAPAERDEDAEDANFNQRHDRQQGGGGGGLLGIPVNFTKALFSQAVGMTTKAPVVLLSVAAALAVLELRREGETRGWASFDLRRREGEEETNGWFSRLSSSRESLTATSPPPPVTVRQFPPHRDRPPGTKLVLEDGSAKYVAKDTVEIIIVPDVLCGRG